MRPSRAKWPVAGMFIAGLASAWAGSQLNETRFFSLALLLFGGGTALAGAESISDVIGGFDELRTAGYALQGIWTSLVGAFQVGLGLFLGWGGVASAALGWSGLGDMLQRRPGPLLVAIGAAFLGTGLHDLLAVGEAQPKGWKLLAGIPFRLAALPAVVVGLLLTGTGLFQTFFPGLLLAWVSAFLGSLAPGP